MFKVWDSQFKKFIDPSDVHINAGTGQLKGIKGGPGYVEEWQLVRPTGLKDKNGVEIYEGDIVTHVNGSFAGGCGEVVLWEGAFTVRPLTSDNALVNYNCPRFVEVIGNIHENPDLVGKV